MYQFAVDPSCASPRHTTRSSVLRCIAQAVADQYGLSLEELHSASKEHDIIMARTTAYAAMQKAGVSVACIADHFTRHHTTVIYALHHHGTQWGVEVESDLAVNTVGVIQKKSGFANCFNYLVCKYSWNERQTLRAYFFGILLGSESYDPVTALGGLMLLLQYPILHLRLSQALATYDLGQHTSRITQHLAKTGNRRM